MTKELFLAKVLRAARRVNIERPPDLAMLMAMVEQESFRKGEPSRLATEFCNLLGMQWNDPKDKGRYESIDFPPNSFEQAGGRSAWVSYRVYDSFEHCIQNWDWHRKLSSLYTKPLAAFRLSGDHRKWLYDIGRIWDQSNSHHADELVTRYDKWLNRLVEGDA